MARVTRSKKIDISEDQTAAEVSTDLDLQTLVELSNNMASEDKGMTAELKGLKAAYKQAIGLGKKVAKGGKNSKRGNQEASTDSEKSNNEMNSGVSRGTNTPTTERPRQVKASDERLKIPQQPTRMTRRQAAVERQGRQEAEKALDNFLAPKSTTTATEHVSVVDIHGNLKQHCEQVPKSTIERIEIHVEDTQPANEARGSPNKSQVVTLEDVEREYGDGKVDITAEDSDDDSFVELITSRSPAKPISRIEDSVEALDQLEEAIDTLNQAALAQKFLSPQKKASPDRSASPRASVTEHKTKKTNFATVRVKPTAPRESILRRVSSMTLKPSSGQESPKAVQQRDPAKRPLSLQAPKAPVKSSKPPTQANFELPGEAVARRLKEQREARRIQREQAETNVKSPPTATIRRTKSTKELTRPAFELPGEALSRKKREVHEARLKVQEEEERKRREFKAKPLRTSLQPSVVPRETVASLARKSKVGFEGIDSIENCNLSLNKRGSNISSSRPSIATVIQANTSAPRSPGTLRRKPSTIIVPSLAGLTTQRTVSATDVQAQRQRAREIYNRDQRETEDFEREKREREAAAKLAREAAAERGRQASREWAERQKAKRASAPDAGMGAGYGPGGQLGLRPF